MRFLKPAVIPQESYPALCAAIKSTTAPDQRILFISDRTAEVANINEALSPRLHVVSALSQESYLDPYTVGQTQATTWHGYYVPTTGEVFSAGDKVKEAAFDGIAQHVIVGFSDIRQFIYDMDVGQALPVYDLYAAVHVDISNENMLNLKRVASQMFSPNAACQRYGGSIDNIAVGIRNYAKWKQEYLTALAANPETKMEDIQRVSGADPFNDREVFELLTMFIFTWLRATMITDFIDAKRRAKTPEEQRAITNSLVLRWWRREAEDRFTYSELFELAMKNIFARSFAMECGIVDFSGQKEMVADYSVETLVGFYESIIQMKDSLRGKLLSTPYGNGNARELARKVCADIIRA